MTLIDKNKDFQHIILTLSESTTIDNAKYLMVLKNDADREYVRLFLPENISDSIERYDLFLIDNTVFQSLELGYYTFNIYQQNIDGNITDESLLGDAIEVGKLFIVDSKVVPVEDQYIVYNK